MLTVYEQTKAVSTAIDERGFEKAMKLRDPEFRESLEGFVTTSALSQDKKLPVEKVLSALRRVLLMLIVMLENANRHHAVRSVICLRFRSTNWVAAWERLQVA
jgi:hypothetical protein